ncbi:MAG: ATP-binding protein [Taibaiella sp.]|nr:ATP-binding protein [Taibaiella sp.]
MKIKIDSAKLTDAPYSAEIAEAFLFDDSEELQQILLELNNARPGSYLVSGYRGSGKTSFINRITERVNGFLVVEINIAKSIAYPNLIKKIIRQLFLRYQSYKGKSNEDPVFIKEFQLLYDRTFNDIVFGESANVKEEEKRELTIEYDLKKLLPLLFTVFFATNVTIDLSPTWLQFVLLVAAAIWSYVKTFKKSVTSTNTQTKNTELSRKSLYDDEIAEHHLFEIFKKLKDQKIKVLVVFDELDKLQNAEKIKEVIDELKPLLLSGYASFMIVAGQSLYYDLEKSVYLDDIVISTLFTKTIHVSFPKNVTLKRFCLGIVVDDEVKANPLVNDYFDNLILLSGRIPRKLINLIRSEIIWDNKQATIVVREEQMQSLRWKARILQAVTHGVDSELASQAINKVQLDFFSAQLFLWVIKMLQFTSIPFKHNDIFEIASYGDHYPRNYKEELFSVWNILIGVLISEGLLKESYDDPEDAGSYTYSWRLTPDESSSESNPNVTKGEEVKEETFTGPSKLQNDKTPETNINQSAFLIDFAELEAYIRDLYLEISPTEHAERLSLRQLIDKFSEMEIINKNWRNSSNLNSLIVTRNKIAHGEAIGFVDLDRVQSSSQNMSRIRSEINEAFAYYVIKNRLSVASELYHTEFDTIEKTTKGGFDVLASASTYNIAFEIKSALGMQVDSFSFDEVVAKFTNYRTISRKKLKFVLFFYMTPGRKTLDEFYYNFNDRLSYMRPELRDDITLFYLRNGNSQGVRSQIEIAIDSVFKNLSDKELDENTIEIPEIKYLTWGKGKWRASFSAIRLKWGENANNELIVFDPTKPINHTPIEGQPHTDNEIHYISDIGEDWAATFHCRIIGGEYKFVFDIFPKSAKSVKKQSENIRFTDWDGIKWEASINHPNINNTVATVQPTFLCRRL